MTILSWMRSVPHLGAADVSGRGEPKSELASRQLSTAAPASNDWTAKVWDAAGGQELLTLRGHESNVLSVAFSDDGRMLAAASNDGTVQIYTLDIQELLDLADRRVTRQMTAEECRRYFRGACPGR